MTVVTKSKTRFSTLKPRRKPAPRSKVEILIQCLQRSDGASIAVLCKATNWQSHVRSALSRMGTRGYKVIRIHNDGRVTRYRVEKER